MVTLVILKDKNKIEGGNKKKVELNTKRKKQQRFLEKSLKLNICE